MVTSPRSLVRWRKQLDTQGAGSFYQLRAVRGADPLLHRFIVVFDREGSHHSLLARLWEHRVGAITYRKNVHDTVKMIAYRAETALVGLLRRHLANEVEARLDPRVVRLRRGPGARRHSGHVDHPHPPHGLASP